MITDFHYGTKLVAALSDEIRVKTVRILSCGPRSGAILEKELDLSSSELNPHLLILIEAELVVSSGNNDEKIFSLKSGADNLITNFLKNKNIPGDKEFCALLGIKA